MVMLVKPEHNSKHLSPKLVTELGMVTLVKPEQREKQYASKLVTELGIVMLVKPEQPLYLQVVLYQQIIH